LFLSDEVNWQAASVIAVVPLEAIKEFKGNVDLFLSDEVNWQAASIIAVVPLEAIKEFKGNATRFHAYVSHIGIFQRRSSRKTMPALSMGCAMRVFRL